MYHTIGRLERLLFGRLLYLQEAILWVMLSTLIGGRGSYAAALPLVWACLL